MRREAVRTRSAMVTTIALLAHVALAQPHDARQADARQSDAQQGDAQQGDAQQGDAQQGDAQQGDAQQGDAQQGDAQQGDAQQADAQQSNPANIFPGDDGTVTHAAPASAPASRARANSSPRLSSPELPSTASVPSRSLDQSPKHAVAFVARPGVSFYRIRRGTAERICLSPCAADLAGPSYLALALDGDVPIEAPEPVVLAPGTIVEGDYRSEAAARHTGWLILGLGVPASLATVATGAGFMAAGGSDEESLGAATIVGGGVAFATSLILGLALGLSPDETHVHVRPSSP